MKKQMLEFLLKRIGLKVDDLREASDERVIDLLADDIEAYLGELKGIISDLVV